jgi:hypothetical protein
LGAGGAAGRRGAAGEAAALRRGLMATLGSLAAVLACLHALAGSALTWRASHGTDPWAVLGSADGSALGLMAPLLLAAAAAAALATVPRPGDAALRATAAALGLIAAADLLALPARLGPGLGAWLALPSLAGATPQQVGAGLAGALACLAAGILVAAPGRSGSPRRGARAPWG